MKTGSLDCLKYLLFFFNLLFFICGIAALAIGIWALINEQSFKQILVGNDVIFNGVYIIIAVGASVFILGFLGCCGAIKESRCMLATFFILVLIILMASIAGVVYVYLKKDDVSQKISDTMSKYGDGSKTGLAITQGWDTVQATMGCCGLRNYTDWKNNTEWKARYPALLTPESCCKRKAFDLESAILNKTLCEQGNAEYLSTEGCLTKLGSNILIVGGIGLAVLFVELLSMIFACCLWRALGDYKTVA